MLTVLQELPMLHHLLQNHNERKLTVPMLLNLLKPKFSEDGSNKLKYEKEVYHLFVRYLREVASGRRLFPLGQVLAFVTGSTEEPVLGFSIAPAIEFVQAEVGFLPTAHTCSNMLSIPMGTTNKPLPPQDELFNLYDLAFSQTYFGKM